VTATWLRYEIKQLLRNCIREIHLSNKTLIINILVSGEMTWEIYL